MGNKTFIFIFLSLIAACSQSGSNTKSDAATIDSLEDRFPEKTRPLLSDLNGFYEVIDTINIDNKVMRYSLYLPQDFDTVLNQSYGGCTFSSSRILYTNSQYKIEPSFDSFTKRDEDDSLYYVAFWADTSKQDFIINKDQQFIINEEYRKDYVASRKALRDASKAKVVLDSIYIFKRNETPRLITECIHTENYVRISLDLIYSDILFQIDIEYTGNLATNKLDEMRTIIQSFEVQEIKTNVNNQ